MWTHTKMLGSELKAHVPKPNVWRVVHPRELEQQRLVDDAGPPGGGVDRTSRRRSAAQCDLGSVSFRPGD